MKHDLNNDIREGSGGKFPKWPQEETERFSNKTNIGYRRTALFSSRSGPCYKIYHHYILFIEYINGICAFLYKLFMVCVSGAVTRLWSPVDCTLINLVKVNGGFAWAKDSSLQRYTQ